MEMRKTDRANFRLGEMKLAGRRWLGRLRPPRETQILDLYRNIPFGLFALFLPYLSISFPFSRVSLSEYVFFFHAGYGHIPRLNPVGFVRPSSLPNEVVVDIT